jgi:phage terminase large subunit-like protein
VTDKELAIAKYKAELPHLYGFKHFKWSREFWESTNRYTFLTMSNQSGKSVISIRKAIRMATDVEFQKRVFKTSPNYGMYFYPSFKLATREFKMKWVKELLPKGSMKDDEKFGWDAEYKDGEIFAVHFKNGFTIYFLSYSQKVSDLQAASPNFVMADEEMPAALWGEISARLMATKGLFSLVCTPTLGEELWRKVFELNLMPNAKVIKATMYDTITFEDGSPGLRTVAEIKDFAAKLPTQRDIDIRVYGKFARAEGLVYPTFDVDKTIVKPLPDALKWPVYCGIDVGSGGHAHPASISFVAVRPDFREARLVRGWCGDNTETTTSVDILRRYQEMKKGLQVVATFYDYQSREFGLQALAADESVLPAEKSHDMGESMLNTLFKHGMLLFEESDFSIDLSVEIQNLKIGTKKQVAKDDRVDSLRYSVVKIPFDMSFIGVKSLSKKKSEPEIDPNDRSLQSSDVLVKTSFTDHIDTEINFWNSLNDDL